jgi:hypothetical protein
MNRINVSLGDQGRFDGFGLGMAEAGSPVTSGGRRSVELTLAGLGCGEGPPQPHATVAVPSKSVRRTIRGSMNILLLLTSCRG